MGPCTPRAWRSLGRPAVDAGWRNPLLVGNGPGDPGWLEHENTGNLHSEWTSVVLACPEPILPSPGNNTRSSFSEPPHLYQHLVGDHAPPGFLVPGISQSTCPFPSPRRLVQGRASSPRRSSETQVCAFCHNYWKSDAFSLQSPGCGWKPRISRNHPVS